MKKGILLKAVIGLAILISGEKTGAQSSLSISEALRTGLQNNFQIRISESLEDIARSNNTKGMAGFYPRLDLLVSNSNRVSNDSEKPYGFDSIATNLGLNSNIELSWTLFNGFKAHINREKFALLEEQSAGNTAIIVENTMQAIILSYYNTRYQQESLEVLKRVLGLSRDRYNYEIFKKSLGSSSTFSLLQFENAYLLDSIRMLQQEVNVISAENTLKLLLAIPVETEIVLSDSLDAGNTDLHMDNLLQNMLSHNPQLLNEFINLEIFRNELKFAESNQYPAVNMRVGTTNNLGRYDTEIIPTINNQSMDYYISFSLSFNLYNGGKVKTSIRNAAIQQQIAQLRIDDAELKLRNELSDLYTHYHARQKIVLLALRNKESASLNLELATDRIKNGTITSFEYRDIQNNYLNAAVNHLKETFHLIEIQTDLVRISGGLLQSR